MRSTWFTRGARAVLALAAVAVVVGVTPAAAKPKPGVKRTSSNLFALTAAIMQVNHQYCPVINTGNVCTDPSGNGVIEGGFWPKGTPDSYIFNSGLQIGGVVDPTAGIPWAGDTTGAFFMDPRGDQADGTPVTLVYNSLDAGDQQSWPSDAVISDSSVYAQVLQQKFGASQQDLWFRAWDGNPTRLGGRAHPMGIAVDTRGMAWNYPTGNEDIIYFVYTFTNVTSSVVTDYDNATAVSHDPTYLQHLADLGSQFQSLNQTKYGFAFPQHGYAFNSVFAAFFEDCDVGTDHVGQNYSTPVFPFNMGVCYEAPFNEPSWTAAGSYTPSIFTGPTFFAGPGFTSVKYLKSPTDNAGNELGLVMFSNTLNSGTGYPDPVGVKQMYRYLSGTSSPAAGDNPCSFQGEQQALHYCFLAQVSQDTRFFESSGPFTLPPGQSKTIVVAYINAPAVNTPFLQTQIGGDFKPGFGATGDSIAKDSTKVRQIERVMGWVTQKDTNGDNRIEQNEVTTVPRSLLNKALVAQAVFDAKFLLPFSPDAPTFFLIPGDNQVTIVWQKSRTEDPTVGGDPYFQIASDPTNALYDPNFRKFDVEGYRIYRGRTPGALQLVAQFDYAGTAMTDYTGTFNWGNCAPELGVNGKTSKTNPATCPTTFQTAPPYTASASVPLVGNVVQIPAGGRVKLASGAVFVTTADTAVTGLNSGLPALSDNGVAFSFIDRSVRNLFQYFYSVTAFDINSVNSGPTSLESARSTKSVTPRALSGNISEAVTVTGIYGGDGTQLNSAAGYPPIDPSNGTFSANMPPANDASMALLGSADVLGTGNISVTIDSVSEGFVGGIGPPPPTIYMSVSAGGNTVHQAVPAPVPAFNTTGSASYTFSSLPVVPYDSAAAHRFGLKFTDSTARTPISFTGSIMAPVEASPGHGTLGLRYGLVSATSAYLAHSRWFDEGGAEPAQPTVTGYPDSLHNSGGLKGVAKIWAPSAYRADATLGSCPVAFQPADSVNPAKPPVPCAGGGVPPFPISPFMRGWVYAQASNWYPGDFVLTWNADSSVSIADVTNHTTLPFVPNGGTGWGFVNIRAILAAGLDASSGCCGIANDGNGDSLYNANINNLGYYDVFGLPGTCSGYWGVPCAQYQNKAQVEPLDFNGDGTADGQGIGLVVNGEYFMFQLSGGVLPAAGTKWHLRAVSGNESATCTPSVGENMTSCSGYTFTGGPRPSLAPGLTYKITVQKSFAVDSTKSGDLSLVHTVPDPYYVTNALEITPNNKVLKFVNLPSRAIIRIYSVSGILVQVLTHNDQTGGGEQSWDLRNRSNQFVASGVYFYHVEGPDGQTKVGRFTVVQFAP